jgi:hypothetical protein
MTNEGGALPSAVPAVSLRDMRAALRGPGTPSLLLRVDRRRSSNAVDLWPIFRVGRSTRQREGAQDNQGQE